MDKIYSRFRLFKTSSLDQNNYYKNKNNNYFRNSKKMVAIVMIFIITIAYTTATVIINSINPSIERKSRILAQSTASKLSSDACSQAMKGVEYKDLCTIEKDADENIKMVKLNVITVNSISGKIVEILQKNLDKNENSSYNIRLGSFTGSKLLAGRGPNVEIKLTLAGNVQTSIKSEFLEAGINQTMHKIYLEIKCNVSVLTPYKDTDEEVNTEVLLAEAVIVGNIPGSYYNLEGLDNKDTINLVN